SPWTRMYRPVTACTVAALALASVSAASVAGASETIPSVAWKRAMGLPLENPGREKPSITYPHVDDGDWQGAPVGGPCARTFSRSSRGDFVRWHLKAGAHKYQPVPANQFAVFQQAEGGPAAAQALLAGHPEGEALSAWKWDQPVGAGDYYA